MALRSRFAGNTRGQPKPSFVPNAMLVCCSERSRRVPRSSIGLQVSPWGQGRPGCLVHSYWPVVNPTAYCPALENITIDGTAPGLYVRPVNPSAAKLCHTLSLHSAKTSAVLGPHCYGLPVAKVNLWPKTATTIHR